MHYPNGAPPSLSDKFLGAPSLSKQKCPAGCSVCTGCCPTDAIQADGMPAIDLGRCLFCGECEVSCPQHSIKFSKDYRMAVTDRDNLKIAPGKELVLAQAMKDKIRRIFGHSLKLRQVSAGGCNACESDVNVLGTIGWDIGRFGIQMVASPRHADGLLVTGCVSENMRIALEKTYQAVAEPKVVIAVGACAISGGPFVKNSQQHGGASSVVPVDLFIPGCPPHPLTILDGLLRWLNRLEQKHENFLGA